MIQVHASACMHLDSYKDCDHLCNWPRLSSPGQRADYWLVDGARPICFHSCSLYPGMRILCKTLPCHGKYSLFQIWKEHVILQCKSPHISGKHTATGIYESMRFPDTRRAHKKTHTQTTHAQFFDNAQPGTPLPPAVSCAHTHNYYHTHHDTCTSTKHYKAALMLLLLLHQK